MNTALNFEDKETKELLSKLNFEFFLNQNIKTENYDKKNIDSIYLEFKNTENKIKSQIKNNRKQYNFYLEGQVRKMFTGGLLPGLFLLDESRKNVIFNFSGYGENWAYFNYWQKYYRRKITTQKLWNIITKIGSVLGILLSISKVIELAYK